MRHIIIVAFVLFMSAGASAREAHLRAAKGDHASAQAEGSASSVGRAGDARVTATDVNAPGSGWGKKAPKESAARVCDYSSAMSDEDIAFCRGR
jgi:hypothetical protein